ncbi:hypothetical protein FB451DRAFT_1446803 [Mycena latifolia]|nr:hypothetical protein FB451DRAFT_1446803 [Mycena latifolia]
MPRQPTEIRLNSIITCLTPAVKILEEVNDAFGTPFIQAIANTTLSLITAVPNVKNNKEECIQLMEHINGIIYSISKLHVMSDTSGTLRPATLYHLGKFAETLHKIHAFVEQQREGNKIKQFFRQSEMTTLLKECHTGLDLAVNVFTIEAGVTVFDNIAEIQQKTEAMHKELLEMISKLSDATSSDRSSSVYQRMNGSQNSSNLFSMLPSEPKIFHGREVELTNIIENLNQESPRIAILGAGGMGKTSLAKAVVHHPDVTTKFEHCVFVPCDSAATSIDLAALIGADIGLKPRQDLTKAVVLYFTGKPACLLVLDNLETPWEPLDSRAGVEEFLSLLTDIKHLALIITMRGAERPAKVRWTRPFLAPLKPLSDEAARNTFVDITDEPHDSEQIAQLLRLTDNMPLAVDLIAHLVDYEGCSNVLKRWETEKTSLLSQGFDRRSSLDASIAISLSCPRIVSLPGAKDLLSLLSILPDGLADLDLLQSDLPIMNVMACKAALLSTSLAYNDNQKRLKSLVPIREHIQHFFPPAPSLLQSLTKHFQLFLELYQEYRGARQATAGVNQITSNLGNLQQILSRALRANNPDISDAIKCTISLNNFSRLTGHGHTALMDRIPGVLPQPSSHRLEIQFITEVFNSHIFRPVAEPQALVSQARSHFANLDDPVLELGNYYLQTGDLSTAMQFFEEAVALSRSCGATSSQCTALNYIAEAQFETGDYPAARIHAVQTQKLAALCANFYEEARALDVQAASSLNLGDYRKVMLLLQRARERLALSGMSRGHMDAAIMSTEADVYLRKSEYAEARSIHTRILQNTSAEEDPLNTASALLAIAEIDVQMGASVQDVHLSLDKSITIFKSVGALKALPFCNMMLAALSLREGDTVAAKSLFQQCLIATWGSSAEVESYCLDRLADVKLWKPSDLGWTSTWTVVYLAYAFKSQHMVPIHRALQCLGDVFVANADEDTARNLFNVALQGFTSMDVHRSRAECMLRLGDMAKRTGDVTTATKLWTEARPLFERSVQTRDVAQIELRLSTVH